MPIVDKFNCDPAVYCFLISTTAGGTGLNLTAANKVVVFGMFLVLFLRKCTNPSHRSSLEYVWHCHGYAPSDLTWVWKTPPMIFRPWTVHTDMGSFGTSQYTDFLVLVRLKASIPSVYFMQSAHDVMSLELVYARQIYKQQQMHTAYEGIAQTRYFEGVQNDKERQGELFGLK